MASTSSIETFYQTVCGEINRLRDEQWRLSFYFISVSLGLIYVYISTGSAREFVDNNTIRCICAGVQIVAAVLYLYHILQTHSYLTAHRLMRRKLEGLMGIQDLTDTGGETVLPIGWQGNAVDKFFEFNTIVVPLTMFVLLLQVLSIWLAWPK